MAPKLTEAQFARFMSRVQRQEDGCWRWTGALNMPVKGYGVMVVSGKRWYAHRLAYEQLVGPIPDGLEIDHLCRNTACVNPAHLEPVTASENQKRGLAMPPLAIRNRAKTTCPAGHTYDRVVCGKRVCSECRRSGYHRRKAMRAG